MRGRRKSAILFDWTEQGIRYSVRAFVYRTSVMVCHPIPRIASLFLLATCCVRPTLAEDRGALSQLAEKVCQSAPTRTVHASFFVMLGFPIELKAKRASDSEKSDQEERIIEILDPGCQGGHFIDDVQPRIVLGHNLNRETPQAELYFYLTTVTGELIKVVHGKFWLDPQQRFRLISPADPFVRSDFQAQTIFWLTRYGLSGR
jgi:hypothetical protein